MKRTRQSAKQSSMEDPENVFWRYDPLHPENKSYFLIYKKYNSLLSGPASSVYGSEFFFCNTFLLIFKNVTNARDKNSVQFSRQDRH